MRQDLHPTADARFRPPLRGHGDDAQVDALLEAVASAVTTGNGRGAAECWAVPAFVVGAGHELVVASLDDVADHFGHAREQYNARGIGDTRPDVQWLEWIGEDLALVEVRWPWLDAQGEEHGSETSTYLLKRDSSGAMKLRVAVMHDDRPGPTHA
jgi:hypothetical protein